jgi:hypothetical protein
MGPAMVLLQRITAGMPWVEAVRHRHRSPEWERPRAPHGQQVMPSSASPIVPLHRPREALDTWPGLVLLPLRLLLLLLHSLLLALFLVFLTTLISHAAPPSGQCELVTAVDVRQTRHLARPPCHTWLNSASLIDPQ